MLQRRLPFPALVAGLMLLAAASIPASGRADGVAPAAAAPGAAAKHARATQARRASAAAPHARPGKTVHAPTAAVANAYPIELAETVPVETRLGNPELRSAHDVWLEMVGRAQKSVDIEGFYLSRWPGEPLDDFLAALGDAVKRGVHVRLLMDRGMSRTYPQPLDSLGTVAGYETRTIDFHRIAGGVQHSKYFIVDDAEIWFGSQNFDWRSLKHVHELGARVRDPRITADFRTVFDYDWGAADTSSWAMRVPPGAADTVPRKLPAPPAQRTIEAPLQVVQAPGDTAIVWPSSSPYGWLPDSTRWDLADMVRIIDGAQHDVVAQALSYAPEEYGIREERQDAAFRRAAARGVHVRLLISDWEMNSRAISWLQKLAQVPNIEVKLSTIPDWSQSYIPFARVEHCKYLVADGATLWLGTANFGAGYFLQSRNMALTIENRRLAQQAQAVFDAGWSGPTAAAIKTEGSYPRKIQGATPPPGKTAYGQ